MWRQLAVHTALSCFIFSLALGLSHPTLSDASSSSRPFWTEKSAFIEGDELFVVGVASRARSVEEGRKLAFENAKIELMNFAQVTNLEARGLVIETQMTHEESNADGSVTVYRLLKIPGKKLLEIQDRVHAESRVQELSIEKSIRELSDIQHGLSTKTSKIEQQQREVESLLKNLEMRYPTSGGAGNQASKADSITSRLESIETTLTAKERELAEISRRASARILGETATNVKRCKLLVLGMTVAEVRAIMGQPRKDETYYSTADVLKRLDERAMGSRENLETLRQGDWFYGSSVEIRLRFLDAELMDISHKLSPRMGGVGTDGCPPS